jgi:hypothetical protein
MFDHAATVDLVICFSLHMRHLSKEQIAGATLIGAFFFLYGEIEMMVPPMILINPLLPHNSFQFMCIILQQEDQQNFVSEREREREREREGEGERERANPKKIVVLVILVKYSFNQIEFFIFDWRIATSPRCAIKIVFAVVYKPIHNR